jgi:hypothetical protein
MRSRKFIIFKNPVIGPYSESTEISPHLHTLFLQILILILLSHLFPSLSTKYPNQILEIILPCPHVLSTSLFLIESP